MTKKRAIVYITDRGFLMPSLFSASQVVSKSAAVELADLFVILVDVELPAMLEEPFARMGVRFVDLPRAAFWRGGDVAFNKTHVPVTSLGRLAMQTVLPGDYEHVLYLDGDTYIAGDIGPLLEHDVGPGNIAAANDCSWLSRGQLGPFWRNHVAYCRGLGVTDPGSYFNAGVLAFRADTWREMAPRALEFFESNSGVCRYHDQSALNALFSNRREVLSPVWNYQSGYAELGLGSLVAPRIYHFTGGLKPWLTRKSVWGPDIYDEYAEFTARYPALASPGRPKPSEGAAATPTFADRLNPRSLVRKALRLRKARRLKRYLAQGGFAC